MSLLVVFGHIVSLSGAAQEEKQQKHLNHLIRYYNGLYPALVGTVTSQGAVISEFKLDSVVPMLS